MDPLLGAAGMFATHYFTTPSNSLDSDHITTIILFFFRENDHRARLSQCFTAMVTAQIRQSRSDLWLR